MRQDIIAAVTSATVSVVIAVWGPMVFAAFERWYTRAQMRRMGVSLPVCAHRRTRTTGLGRWRCRDCGRTLTLRDKERL